jgi:hypothetical protein
VAVDQVPQTAVLVFLVPVQQMLSIHKLAMAPRPDQVRAVEELKVTAVMCEVLLDNMVEVQALHQLVVQQKLVVKVSLYSPIIMALMLLHMLLHQLR